MTSLRVHPVIIPVGLFSLITLACVALAVFCFRIMRKKRVHHNGEPNASRSNLAERDHAASGIAEQFRQAAIQEAIPLMAEMLKERLQAEALNHVDASERLDQGQQS
jgi:type III secretory pathway component EscV